MSKRYLFLIVVILIVGAIALEFYKPKEKEHFEPKVVKFPYSWKEKGYPEDYALFDSVKQVNISITVFNITAFGKNFRRSEAEEGYQYYNVYVTYKNLGHQKYSRPKGYSVGVYLELVTNRSNIYKSETGLFAGTISELKPEEVKEEWIRFLIQADEKPVELRNYEVVNDELKIAYIWKII